MCKFLYFLTASIYRQNKIWYLVFFIWSKRLLTLSSYVSPISSNVISYVFVLFPFSVPNILFSFWVFLPCYLVFIKAERTPSGCWLAFVAIPIHLYIVMRPAADERSGTQFLTFALGISCFKNRYVRFVPHSGPEGLWAHEGLSPR